MILWVARNTLQKFDTYDVQVVFYMVKKFGSLFLRRAINAATLPQRHRPPSPDAIVPNRLI
jgi:hypothetical protein